ncbi:MAG: hypothetical protein Q9186_004179 [Xanthomendoza sp. 1 TL-2023]
MYSRSILAAFIGALTFVAGHEEDGGSSESPSAANTCTTTATVSITTDVVPSLAARSSSLPPTVSLSVTALQSSVTSVVVPSVISSASLLSTPEPLATGSGLTVSSEESTTVQVGTSTNAVTVPLVSPIISAPSINNSTSIASALTSITVNSTSVASTTISTSSATETTSSTSSITAAATTSTAPENFNIAKGEEGGKRHVIFSKQAEMA